VVEIWMVEVVMLEVHHLILPVEERVMVVLVDLVHMLRMELLVLSILGETVLLPVQVVEEGTMEEGQEQVVLAIFIRVVVDHLTLLIVSVVLVISAKESHRLIT